MRKDKIRVVGMAAGAPSLLSFFIVLTLAVFASLFFASASEAEVLSEKAALASKKYYEADSRAEELLSHIDTALIRAGDEGLSDEAYQKRCAELAGMLEGVAAEIEGIRAVIYYNVSMPDSRSLEAALVVNDPAAAERYDIISWKIVNTGEWDLENEPLDLWPGPLSVK